MTWHPLVCVGFLRRLSGAGGGPTKQILGDTENDVERITTAWVTVTCWNVILPMKIAATMKPIIWLFGIAQTKWLTKALLVADKHNCVSFVMHTDLCVFVLSVFGCKWRGAGRSASHGRTCKLWCWHMPVQDIICAESSSFHWSVLHSHLQIL